MQMKWKSILLRIWQIALLILIGICFVTLTDSAVAASRAEETQETLSKVGSSGTEVRSIQQKLTNLGYNPGPIDGVYGSATLRAVKQFQTDHGLTADGIAGVKTLQALGLTGGTVAESRNDDAELLARVISAEARGESYTGQVAVGAVILNRVSHPSFPNTVAGVVYQPGAFTCMTDGQINQPIADSARQAAQDALNGWDPTGGAIYYYNPAKTSNAWMRSLPVLTTIGAHIFCSEKK